MKGVVSKYLRNYVEQLPDLYRWNPDEKILKDRFGIDTSKSATALEKNVHLKNALTEIIQNNGSKANKIIIANYIIKDWGGIRRFDNAGEIVESFQEIEFSETIPNYRFDYSGISSWSKYLSIIAPEWACIYDARVAYSLNVINYISGSIHRIFPVPSGRNSKITLLDIETLLLAAKIRESDSGSPKELRRNYYIKETEVYRTYSNLIKELHDELWEPTAPIQYTEMLLFAISDNFVYQDLLKFCKKS